MEIPESLSSQIRDGKAVLFLGAGASRDALLPNGQKAPIAGELATLLSNAFLGGEYRGYPLNQIAEYAISERDLGTVQGYIREIFLPLAPTAAHKLMCAFNWYGLATTNYDCLVEKAYELAQKDALQNPVPLIENSDKIDDSLRDPDSIAFLKLHGCITRVTSPICPLILTTDQYIEHRQGRSRLFDCLKDWAYEHPIVFIGHSLQDADIRTILLDLSSLNEYRPRYFVVAPDVDAVKARFWESKKITALRGSFDEFMKSLDSLVPQSFRKLGAIRTTVEHPIEERFKVNNANLSRAALVFLNSDVDYVRNGLVTERVEAKAFYRGFNPEFSAIEQSLDVRRRLGDSILSDYFLRTEQDLSTGVESVLIKAHAGAGKSVLLRRLAWDAAHEFERICLFVKPHGVISAGPLQELITLCKERVYLFVDDAADRVRELQALFKSMGPEGKFLTVILGERINEWNVQGSQLAPYISEEYELKYMTTQEVDSLLGLLEKNRSLGTLERLTPEKRREALAERAGRQLLVALHEATLGDPFVKILVDEYRHIEPFEAQQIYLTICVLNRLDVPVRAGIISRIHGVPFEEFKQRFFSPLEHVVFAEYDPVIRDYVYRARHPYIADVVFMQILSNQEERFDAYIRCLQSLNIAYSADRKAFWKMMRGRTLLSLFANQEMIRQLYDAARASVGDDAHLLHQMALYEMNREGGNLAESARLLAKATSQAPYDQTIKHSSAELKLKSAENTGSSLERAKLFKEAASISSNLISSERADSHAHHTLVKIGISQLEEAIGGSASDLEIQKLVKQVEQHLFDAQQLFPGDSYLLETEARLGTVLNNNQRALAALEKAFQANPRSSFIALRLASVYERQGQTDPTSQDALRRKAREVLEKGLNANNADCRLHYALAKLLMKLVGTSGDLLEYHLQRAFNEGDANHEAQLLYGRQLFLNGRVEESRSLFTKLSEARVGPQARNKIHYPIEDQRFEGRIAKREFAYGFVAREGTNDWIYVHSSNLRSDTWESVTHGTRLAFKIGFTLKGAAAFDVNVIG
jgi:cold shock CspA family protein